MAITLNNICKAFGEKQVLHGFSCVLPDHSWTLITGPSGCGKTTLFRIFLGLEREDAGTITGLTGKNSAVFQENRLCEELTVEENIRLVLPSMNKEGKGSRQEKKNELEQKINAALNHLGILENKAQPAAELSGGMKRRCAIARAVLTEADLYLLDEPFYGLDKQIKEDTMDFLAKELKGKTAILITHDQEAIDYLKERQLVDQEIKLEKVS